jgi:hypothetical protein
MFDAARPRSNTLALWLVLAALLGLQASLAIRQPRSWQTETSPGPLPAGRVAQLAGIAEPAATAYAMTLFLQTFDAQAGVSLKIRTLDFGAIRDWLARSSELYPRSAYPLLLAARVYAESAEPDQARALLELVEQRFSEAPNERWPWLAHAVFVARHVLHDLPLARRYARDLRERATGAQVPRWVGQAEIFLLADANELDAARALLGGLIESGRVTDAAERAFLLGRLNELNTRLSSDRRGQTGG